MYMNSGEHMLDLHLKLVNLMHMKMHVHLVQSHGHLKAKLLTVGFEPTMHYVLYTCRCFSLSFNPGKFPTWVEMLLP